MCLGQDKTGKTPVPALFAVNCLEKVLYLGKPQERTFRCQLSTVNCQLFKQPLLWAPTDRFLA